MKKFFGLFQESPPDLDEIFNKLKKKLSDNFKNNGNSSDNFEPNMPSFKFPKWLLFLVVIIVLGAVFVFDMFYIVGPAERGIEQRFGKYLRVTEPGPHFKLPSLIDKVTTINTEEILAISFGSKRSSSQVVMLTSDENIMEVQFVIQYRISDPVEYLFNTSQPVFILSEALESAMRMVVGQSLTDDIIQQPAEIAVRAKEELQRLLDNYKIGLEVTSLNIQDVQPPAQVKDAYNDAVKAREDLQRLINEAEAYSNDVLPKARGRAARVLEEARAYREQVIAKATGEASRFEKVLQAYQTAPLSTKERLYIETMEGIYSSNDKVFIDSDASGSNNHFLLPLDRFINGNKRPISEYSPSNQGVENVSSSDFNLPDSNISSPRTRGAINLQDRIRIQR